MSRIEATPVAKTVRQSSAPSPLVAAYRLSWTSSKTRPRCSKQTAGNRPWSACRRPGIDRFASAFSFADLACEPHRSRRSRRQHFIRPLGRARRADEHRYAKFSGSHSPGCPAISGPTGTAPGAYVRAQMTPLSGNSLISGACMVLTISTRAGSSPLLSSRCAPSRPARHATTSPGLSRSVPSSVLKLSTPARTTISSSFAWWRWSGNVDAPVGISNSDAPSCSDPARRPTRLRRQR